MSLSSLLIFPFNDSSCEHVFRTRRLRSCVLDCENNWLLIQQLIADQDLVFRHAGENLKR
jgi:hypothetical protein